ncbi:MAG: LPS assembly lipoprotein LptE [Cypionkella sp.]|jgi:LPS-assembly lipoprotein|nr:LPS assembly lipoprotein LptE [Cypionkella sp.]
MSLFNRRTVLFVPLALAACGFAPAYGPGGAAAGLQGRIRVADPTDKLGFDLVERLEERLGRPEAPMFDLAYTINTRIETLAITPADAITRYHLQGTIDWTLTDRSTGQRATGGTVQGFTAYSATGSTVAGLAAEQDAAFRLMRMLADQIVTKLIATAGTWA